jgi:hypothetical protein
MRLLALVILACLSPALACAQDSFDIDAADGFPGMRFVAEPSKQLAASHLAWAPQDGVHVPRVLVLKTRSAAARLRRALLCRSMRCRSHLSKAC